MAKTPSKPVRANKDEQLGKTKPATKVRKAADPQSEEPLQPNKTDIDEVLGLCADHLKKLGKPELAHEVIRRL